MHIRIDLERYRAVPLAQAQFAGLFADAETTLSKFPKLRKLTRMGGQDLRLDMQTIGSSIARIAHDVSFGARCTLDASRCELGWKPLPGVGNAQIEGLLHAAGEGMSTRLSLHVRGELNDVPVPLMYRLVAPAFIQGKFSALIDAYLEKLVTLATSSKAQATA